MNHVPAVGAPGSLMRRMQEHPALAVDLLRSLKALLSEAEQVASNSYHNGDRNDTNAIECEWKREEPEHYALIVTARAAIAAAEEGTA